MAIFMKIVAATAFLLPGATSAVLAQVTPGHIHGENFAVAADPSRTNNTVGGGLVRTQGAGDGMSIEYAEGYRGGRGSGNPGWSGGGEHGDLLYTPFITAPVRSADTRR